MINQELAKRYAKALYQITSGKPQVKSDLTQAIALMDRSPNLSLLLQAPQLNKEEKAGLIKKSFPTPLDPDLESFLLFLLQKGRIRYLPNIAKAYKKMANDGSGVIEAKLITAIPADPSLKDKLKARLESSYAKKIELEEILDHQMIGGVSLVIGNQMIDGSIRNRLTKLKKNLLDIPV